ncbi:ultraviolet-B receptor UVR8 [Pelomyxa schiedti]|nr:ultraviolet-B receptor UVR8 [Pelomyxa schiedti]
MMGSATAKRSVVLLVLLFVGCCIGGSCSAQQQDGSGGGYGMVAVGGASGDALASGDPSAEVVTMTAAEQNPIMGGAGQVDQDDDIDITKSRNLLERDQFSLEPLPVVGIPRLTQICAGGYFSAGITEKDSELVVWGFFNGEIKSPTVIQFPEVNTKVARITCGSYHILVLDDKGRVYSFGRGLNGVLGHGGENDEGTPRVIKSLSRETVVSIGAGFSHSAAITSTHKIYTWGLAEHGQLGRGTKPELIPKLVRPEMTVPAGHSVPLEGTEICCGGHYTAILSGKEVFTFGSGDFGAVGHGTAENTLYPRVVEGLPPITNMSCGGDHIVVITENGEAFSWGWNYYGQMCRQIGDVLAPEKVSFPNHKDLPIHTVSASSYANSYFVLESAGKQHIYACGCAEYGGVGIVSEEPQFQPFLVELSHRDVVQVSAGYRHSLFLTATGEVYGMGDNTYNQMGVSSSQ